MQIPKLFTIRSQAIERIHNFYLQQEAGYEHMPLASWRDGHKLKSSDVYVEMQLLTNQIRLQTALQGDRQTNDSNQRQTSLDNNLAAVNNPANQNINQGLRNEIVESRSERKSTKQREAWKKVFRGTGLRLIFKGGAGSGKSFSLGQEVCRRLVRARTELENFNCSLNELEIPILVKASSLVTSNREKVEDAILDTLLNLSGSGTPQLKDWIRHGFESERGRRLFIVIDGLDELPETSQHHFRERMKQLNALDAASLIVSCRTMYFDERQDWISWIGEKQTKVVELAPLEKEQQSEMIGKLIGINDISKETLPMLLKKNYSLSYFCRTPLVLTFACLLYSEGWLSENINYASLYKALTKRMLSGEWRDISERPTGMSLKSRVLRDAAQHGRIDLLPQISWHLFRESPSENRFTLKQWREAYQKVSNRGEFSAPDAIQLLSEMELVGMITNAGYDADYDLCYSFIHRTILEYFAAVGLVEQHDDSVWVEIITKHIWCESAWIEVIRFAASLVNNPTRLLQSVAKETGAPSVALNVIGKLDNICRTLRAFSISILIIIFLVIGASIWDSNEAGTQAVQYFSNFGQYLPETLTQSFNLFINDPARVINSLLNEFLKLYNFIFQIFYDDTLYSKAQYNRHPVELISWIEFLIPYLAVLAGSMLIISIPLWTARKIFYQEDNLKQDDIFRTGLVVQAEIIGQNNNASDSDVERIINELLASEKTESTRIYGAAEDGAIPESLLQLIGSNTKARQRLNDHWLAVVNKRYKNFQKINRRYKQSNAWHKWLLLRIQREKALSLFKARDFRKATQLVYGLAYGEENIYEYLREKLNTETQQLLKENENDKSKKSGESLLIALVTDFNEILKDPFLYNETRFQSIELRTETKHLLKQQLTGEKLMHLNRLLLEDAFSYKGWFSDPYNFITRPGGGIKRKERLWLRFIRWAVKKYFYSTMWGLRNSSDDSELFRAFRGLFLLPDKKATESLKGLLRQNAKMAKHLSNANFTVKSFDQLDIYAAKLLANMGNPAGKRKLSEFASWLDNKNKHTPLAIKELSLFDEKLAIELASRCIKDGWRLDDRYDYVSIDKFSDILFTLSFDRVIAELNRLSAEDIGYFNKVLFVEYLLKMGDETAKEWLEKAAINKVNQEVSAAAREVLGRDSLRPWFDGDDWIHERVLAVKKLIDEKEFERAAKQFNELIYGYPPNWHYKPDLSVFTRNLEKVASLGNERMLESWLVNHGYSSPVDKNLVRLAKEPTGKVIKETLIKWTNDPRFDNSDFSHGWKSGLLLALGDVGDGETEKALFQILKKARKKISLFNRRTSSVYNDAAMIAGLGKIRSEESFKEIQEELKYSCSWVSYYVEARLLAERDDPRALESLLRGKFRRGTERSWESGFGDEPTLHDLAHRFGARITKVNYNGYWEYIAVSGSRNFKYRMPV